MSDTNHDQETAMRDLDAPTPKTIDELRDYIDNLAGQQHTYGTCVYAMSLAATATFNFMASRLGVTGFQASMADMDILRRTRGYRHGFMVLDASRLLYPQYDLQATVNEWIAKTRLELADEAARLLAQSPDAAPRVRARWREIAALKPASPEETK